MKKIHIISESHLDLGFTDFAANVENIYREEFIPHAIALAKVLNKKEKQFIWTTGAWLIDNALRYSTVNNRIELDKAIRRGDIAPHGLPFTTHSELLDEDTFRYGLEIATILKARYNLNICSAKMTDVPGQTKAIIPLLQEFSIKLLHIGVNEGSAMPNVPPCFLWKCDDSEVVVIYEGNNRSLYKNEFIDDILCFDHSSGNRRPNGKGNLLKLRRELKRQYKDYAIVASTLDSYAEVLWRVRDKLPVITSEIGDSWIHGVASDPYKSAAIRELISMKKEWMADGSLVRGSDEYYIISDYILMMAEHTWGMDVKRNLSDIGIYLKKDFVKARKLDKVKLKYMNFIGIGYKLRTRLLRLTRVYKKGFYSVIEKSWQEKRAYIDKAVEGMSELHKKEAYKRLTGLRPPKIIKIEDAKVLSDNTIYNVGKYSISFNQFGSIKTLKYGEDELIKPHDRSVIDYTSYGSKDYDYWLTNYSRDLDKNKSWVIGDFARPLLKYYDNKFTRGTFPYTMDKLSFMDYEDKAVFLVRLVIEKHLTDELGAPKKIKIRYTLNKKTFSIKQDVNWIGKEASRLSESIFLHFYLNCDLQSLRYIKMGREINPYDIVENGNRNLSAVEQIEFSINSKEYVLINHHSPLVALGQGKILKFDNWYESIYDNGLSFNLYNNVWGTNYPLWYNDNAFFSYELKLK